MSPRMNASPSPSPTVRTDADWLADLRSSGPNRDAALVDLRAIVLAGLPYALANWLSPNNPQFDALAEDVAQETLMRVMDRLDTYAGRSQVTTWVHKIAVHIAITELRHRRWKDVSLEALMEGEASEVGPRAVTAAHPMPDADRLAEQTDVLLRVQRVILEELTDKQRWAMIAVAIKGIPMDEVARHMNMERNTLYKLMHDARLRLKRRLIREGLDPADVLALFERD
jgi:RNA polymerase sigma-70 factor (ECF subfamily)